MNPQTEQASIAQEVARHVLAKLRDLAPLDPNGLWDVPEIGRYGNVSASTARRYTRQAWFPQPIVACDGADRRWKGKEVMAAWERRRGI